MEDNEEKVFEHYLVLPEKARMAVIDGMGTPEKCRFTRCSKLSSREAQASKNYIYRLVILYFTDSIGINVLYGFNNSRYSFALDFVKIREKIVKQYRNSRSEVLWRMDVNNSLDLLQNAMGYFKTFLHRWQRNIKALRVQTVSGHNYSKKLKHVDFEIEKMDSLEELIISGTDENLKMLSKLRKPLKKLGVIASDRTALPNYEQVYKVQQCLVLRNVDCNDEQLLRLTAEEVIMPIGTITEKGIFHFIRSWQNGTIGSEITRYTWLLHSNFNTQKLLRLLRCDQSNFGFVEIKHFHNAGKTATFRFSESSLHFYI